tara:strand:+ start:3528 stop:4304 length:777 start_codon:yes stop_codon:yes gene_type:complete
MKKPNANLVTVVKTETITPNMQRILLQGDALSQFPVDCEGGYIKLLFNHVGGTDISNLKEGERPVMRTYTIRRFYPDQSIIEVDFVRHLTQDQQCGFASRWAMSVEVGATISIAGPGTIQNLNTEADWFFMVADMTALPALSAKVRLLPTDANGYAVIQVHSKEDIQPLDTPKNMRIEWVVSSNVEVAETVRALPWLSGTVSVWCACEFDSMRALRTYFRNEKEVNRENIYISSYWKQGVSEDGHKVLKQQDANEQQG